MIFSIPFHDCAFGLENGSNAVIFLAVGDIPCSSTFPPSGNPGMLVREGVGNCEFAFLGDQ